MNTNLQHAGSSRVLGPDHPLARVPSQLSLAAEQCFAVSVVLATGVYALIDGLSIGVPLTMVAAAVLAGLLARVGALVESRNDRAVDLIGDGRGSLPVEAVLRARRRLRDPVARERLARTFDVIGTEVARLAGACHSTQSVDTLSVVRAVSSELGEVARLERASGALAARSRARRAAGHGRPVTAVWRCRGGPARELCRSRFLLSSSDADHALEWGSLPFRAGRRGRSLWTGRPRAEVTVGAKPAKIPPPRAAARDTMPAMRGARAAR